jgi:hypothetical protein
MRRRRSARRRRGCLGGDKRAAPLRVSTRSTRWTSSPAVAFRIELFVVLEHGRKTGLSVARFIQGAANGFRRVLEVVEGEGEGEGEGVMRATGEEDGWSRMRE